MDNINTYEAYLTQFLYNEDPILLEMEQYAKENYIPIMDKIGIESFIGLLKIQKPERILEIGSAIGYSAIRMAKALPQSTIVTIERDEERALMAKKYIEAAQLKNRIQLILDDALELDLEKYVQDTFDAVFIDAAKGQYQRFFEKYIPFLKRGGVIYCDNIFMHGMVLLENEEVPKRNRTMIRKLKEFTAWMMEHPDVEATILPIGDGLIIATKK